MFTVGVYDLMHVGHVELFRRAKSLGDRLIVGVQDSGSVQKYKPSAKPVYSTEERAYLVSSISYVDEVVIYEDVEGIVRQTDFDLFVTGPDQTHDGFRRAIEWCESHGRRHVVLPRTEGHLRAQRPHQEPVTPSVMPAPAAA